MVQGLNPGGGEIFRIHPDWPWGPPSLVYSGYQVFASGVKESRRGVGRPPPSGADVEEGVELYPYSLSGPVWSVLG